MWGSLKFHFVVYLGLVNAILLYLGVIYQVVKFLGIVVRFWHFLYLGHFSTGRGFDFFCDFQLFTIVLCEISYTFLMSK